jgi:hypothetical protein
MQNSNLTALAALRNLRGKVGNDKRQPAKPNACQRKSLITVPDHFLVIGPDTERNSALDNDVYVPTTIHR